MQGRYGEAAPLYVRATDIGKRTLGGDHPDVAAGLADWADLLCAQVRVMIPLHSYEYIAALGVVGGRGAPIRGSQWAS